MVSGATASTVPETPAARTPRPIGFDNEKYLAEQSAAILERAGRFRDKLCLEK